MSEPSPASISVTALATCRSEAVCRCVSTMAARAFGSITRSARGCEMLASPVATKTRCTAPGVPPAGMRTTAPSVRNAAFSAAKPPDLNEAVSARCSLTQESSRSSAGANGMATSLAAPPAKRPLTKTSVVHGPVGAACREGQPRSALAREISAAGARASSALAIGETLVYFHASLPRRAVGKPVSAKRSMARLRRSASRAGADSPAAWKSAR